MNAPEEVLGASRRMDPIGSTDPHSRPEQLIINNI